MTVDTNQSTETLYEQDYNLWLETIVKKLRLREFSGIDLDNLIEELESMGRSDKRALKSLLTRLFEHLLKIAYWETEREYNQNKWKVEIRTFRQQIADLLNDSPSLNNHLNSIFEECYHRARKNIIDLTGLSSQFFPDTPISNIEEILDENWLPEFDK
ncbi:DUF29 domain-containing protein [Crocosphaera sp.]|uniref:DUF29 domain-containing protein n=1 Tax=Crocosphaera sp. TaxID=2729996 RepID=UPI002630B89D|nr:DUF29 domain-containing protein [Crocosphaera sp.]MDJ0581424.1 DUF29 domain-containing protein [Crocosphaera sp.]